MYLIRYLIFLIERLVSILNFLCGKDIIISQISYEKSYNQLEKVIEKANEEIAAGADFEDLKILGPFENKELLYNSSAL